MNDSLFNTLFAAIGYRVCLLKWSSGTDGVRHLTSLAGRIEGVSEGNLHLDVGKGSARFPERVPLDQIVEFTIAVQPVA